jgi:Tol biopolymer transport system component
VGRLSPDRTHAAFISIPEASDEWRSELWVVDADGGGQRMLVDDAFRFGPPSWSPDGRSIIFVTAENYGPGSGPGLDRAEHRRPRHRGTA